MDPYAILGVAPGAEDEVIVAAYRALVKLYHPDRYEGDVEFATSRLKELNAAFDILSDPKKRQAFDKEHAKRNHQFDENSARNYENSREDKNNSDWIFAINFHPKLELLHKELSKIDIALASSFKIFIIHNKAYSKGQEAFCIFKNEYMKKKFGENSQVRDLAYEAIVSGQRNFAIDLNEALARVGQDSSDAILRYLARKYSKFAESEYFSFGFGYLLEKTQSPPPDFKSTQSDRPPDFS